MDSFVHLHVEDFSLLPEADPRHAPLPSGNDTTFALWATFPTGMKPFKCSLHQQFPSHVLLWPKECANP